MGLEVTTTIDGLNASWPIDLVPNDDPITEGDDHIRLLKVVIKNIFPGITTNGFNTAILAYETELNYLTGLTSILQTQLDTLSDHMIPIGGIIQYSGLFINIPLNYQLCNGVNGTPDMTKDLVYGTNTEFEVGDIGGTDDQVNIAHTHTADHNHSGSTGSNGNHSHNVTSGGSSLSNSSVFTVRLNTGSSTPVASSFDGTHRHILTVDQDASSFTTDGASGTGLNVPPYIKLAHIQRMA